VSDVRRRYAPLPTIPFFSCLPAFLSVSSFVFLRSFRAKYPAAGMASGELGLPAKPLIAESGNQPLCGPDSAFIF